MPWAKLMCQTRVPPKYLFISWLLMQERLATCAYMQRIGVVVDQLCCFCGEVMETEDHLFFQCIFSAGIWEAVMEWCGLRREAVSWSAEKRVLLSHCTNNNCHQRLYRCVLVVMIYHIWRARNHRRLQGKVVQIAEVVHQCKVVIALCGRKDSKVGRCLRN